MDTTTQRALLHRLNRIQGQIEALKHSIIEPKDDCLKNIQQVKATHAAIKRFGEEYVKAYASRCSRDEHVSKKFRSDIDMLISSAFTI